MPISQHPFGDLLLKMNVSQAAKGANWLEWSAGSAPKQINLGLSSSDLLRMSCEAYRLLEAQSGPMNFIPPSPPVTSEAFSAIGEVAAKVAKYFGEKYSNFPMAPNGFDYQTDGDYQTNGTLEPAGKHELSSDDIKDVVGAVTGIYKKLSRHHQRHVYCAFMAEPVWMWKPEPAWPSSQMCRIDEGWVKRIFPNPTARFDIQVCRMQYSDYLIMTLRSYECDRRQ